jgi:hypothetical protein
MMFIVIMVASCAQSTESILPRFTAVSTQQVNSTSPMRVATETPNTSPIPTLDPTLPVEDARKRLLELLSNNGNCHLPCLWNITPGKSTYQEAQIILAPLGSISDVGGFGPEIGSISPVYTKGDLWLITRATYLATNQTVTRVVFQARALKRVIAADGSSGFNPIFNSQLFGERLNYYMLPHMLTEQGIPTSVKIASHGGAAGFGILILYPERGLLIDYSAQMDSTDMVLRGCPANAHVEMELYPPGTSDSFYELLQQTDWSTRLNNYKPLEEVTSLSIEEFYQTFKEPNDGCIETSTEFWPTPVP